MGTDAEGDRVDRFLAKRLGISRARVQRAIDSGLVTVAGLEVPRNRRLKSGERIRIACLTVEGPPPALPEKIPLDIVYEDSSLLVLNKPAGMVVHPAPGHFTGTLLNALLSHLAARGEGLTTTGIVHRLDKDTTGLILVAKSDEVKNLLSQQMKERKISRSYRAIVWGHMRELEGTFEASIGRHPHDRKKMSTYARKRRAAKTTYRVLESFDVCEYVEAQLHTGRTHQVRVHFSSVGHPLLGDATYGGGEGRETAFMGEGRRTAKRILALIKRQALHAYRLGFAHPVTGEPMEFISPLPADMQAVLAFLRGTAQTDS